MGTLMRIDCLLFAIQQITRYTIQYTSKASFIIFLSLSNNHVNDFYEQVFHYSLGAH